MGTRMAGGDGGGAFVRAVPVQARPSLGRQTLDVKAKKQRNRTLNGPAATQESDYGYSRVDASEPMDTDGVARLNLARPKPPPPQVEKEREVAAGTPARANGGPKSDAAGGGAAYYPDSLGTTADEKGWDVFRTLPPPPDNYRQSFWVDVSLQLLKVLTYAVVFILLLGSAIVSKSVFLLMTSAVGLNGHNITICYGPVGNSTAQVESRHVVKWVWGLYVALCVPELICFIRCLHRVVFRNVKRPTVAQFLIVVSMETLHAVGVGLLVFKVLPGLDAVTGAMLGSCLAFAPAVLALLSRRPGRMTVILVFLDLAAIAAQSSGFWAWPVFIPELSRDAWAVPASITLISIAWWPNFVSHDSVFPFIRAAARLANSLSEKRSKTYVVVSLWKCLVYFCTLFAFVSLRMSVADLLEEDPFGIKPMNVFVAKQSMPLLPKSAAGAPDDRPTPGPWTRPPPDPYNTPSPIRPPSNVEVVDIAEEMRNQGVPDHFNIRNTRDVWGPVNERVRKRVFTTAYDALWVVLIQAVSGVICYQCGKFACKVMMHRIGLALPLALAGPVTVFALAAMCGAREQDPCYGKGTLPVELFWKSYRASSGSGSSIPAFFATPQTWVWLVWWLSQLWISLHLWFPKCPRLAHTDRLFVLPWFSAVAIDLGLALNRRKDDKANIKTEDIELDGDDSAASCIYETINPLSLDASGATTSPAKSLTPASLCSEASSKMPMSLNSCAGADAITKIYACATMWHESPIEMMCMLKSVFRMDEDQSARRNAQKYLKIVDPDYYEFEAHIFFDDAFEMSEYGEPQVNTFVRHLLDKVDEAASAVHQTQMRLKPPKKAATPYGGRVTYILPGKNRLTVHCKDKTKIRHRKRWSQVMYLYYLLGFRVMQKVEGQRRKEVISENSYILTLDGDVDFSPNCIHLLVDLMKKNRRLGAACGRIHPRGSGLMIWYQKFEYAIGHWFQKATEHMIGCVLCSPGCFSLFRACALMDDNVARRYATKSENPRDYIQYDQGEDRWLCTLLLQRGYRVEYCAASDALTFAPEGFNEFFNQRRRWIPSTIANILDLLVDYRNVVRVNESISIWYIAYQFVMLISSVLGPGTIFLMVVGAISISFNLDTSFSFLAVLGPVIFFGIVCYTCRPNKQLAVAQVIGALFAMLMTAVIVGTALQIKKDGIYSPHAIFLFAVITSFFIAACLHPLEFTCIIPGVLYFMAIPCMYMLLPVYSVCNLHVVSWGTRENPKVDEDDPLTANSFKKNKNNFSLLESGEGGPGEAGEIDGVYSLGCGSVCRLMCCLQPSAIGASPQMAKLDTKMEELDKKLDRLDRRLGGEEQGPHSRRWTGPGGQEQSKSVFSTQADEDDMLDDNFDLAHQELDAEAAKLRSESWLNQRCLRRADRDFLEPEEDAFWKEAIDKYLFPLKQDKLEVERIKKGLSDLRNKVSFAFFMLNAIFILIVFLLQVKKDCLHIEWPLGPLVNHSVIPCNSDVREEIWIETRLELEPIGLVFLLFFVSILVLQFFAMLLHRFGTLSHILASTELFCSRKASEKLSEEELVVQNAVEIARELQAIRGVDVGEADPTEDPAEMTISRRRVVHNLENSRRSLMNKRRTETLDAAFKKRFFALNSDRDKEGTPVLGSRSRLTMRKGTIRALENRRKNHFGTLDQATAADGSAEGRGPSRRRLDRIFHHKNGETRAEGGPEDAGSSDEDQDLKTTSEDTLRKQQPADFSNVTGTHRHPLRKLISPNPWDVRSGRGGATVAVGDESGLLDSESRDSPPGTVSSSSTASTLTTPKPSAPPKPSAKPPASDPDRQESHF